MSVILYLMPGGGMDPAEIARREQIANTFLANPDKHQVTVASVGYGAEAVESTVEADFSVMGLVKHAVDHRGEYDALIIGCGDDPGLFSLREMLDVPVVGPMECSVALTQLLGERFALITTGAEAVAESRALYRKYGVINRCASIRYLDAGVLDMQQGGASRASLVQRFADEVAKAAGEGADSAVMGCMTMAYLLLDEDVNKLSPIPIVNPAKVAVKTAETLLDLNLRHSDAGYPKPNFAPIYALLR